MIRLLILLAVAAGSAWFGYVHALEQAPIQEMEKLERANVTAVGGYNITMRGFERRNMKSKVPSSNPDVLFVSCIYNLAKGPLRIYGQTSPHYWSLSLYAHNTDNYFVANDRELAGDRFDYLLVAEDAPPVQGDDTAIIRSPTSTGVVLMRYFVPTDADVPEISERIRQSGCEGEIVPP
ncbi:MAG: DUF1254 domain-containing protein [Alphaproteobacteria bacterium]|nr:DUF1254 domain-containing protein [Alphaproteobacteria bacterium]